MKFGGAQRGALGVGRGYCPPSLPSGSTQNPSGYSREIPPEGSGGGTSYCRLFLQNKMANNRGEQLALLLELVTI